MIALLLRPTQLLSALGLLLAAAPALAQRAPLDPTRVLGAESCRECHDSIVESWERSRHALSFGTLTQSEAAKAIASLAGLKTEALTTSVSCARCHFTQETLSGALQTTAAVSCESCHGGAGEWIDLHNSKSRPRAERVAQATAHGMRHPASVLAAAQSCYECHVIDNEQLVNKTGHPALSEGFGRVAWYGGDGKHNYLVSKPGKAVKTNVDEPQAMPAARKRLLFLTGKLLHLSHSLAAIARSTDAPVDKAGKLVRLANGRPTYAVQHALVVQQLLKELRELQSKLSIPEYAQTLALVTATPLTTGHAEELSNAAKEIERLAAQFAEKNDGSRYTSLDGELAKLAAHQHAAR